MSLTTKAITRHVWHVIDEERPGAPKLGWIRRHVGERATVYETSLPDGQQITFPTFDHAMAAFEYIAREIAQREEVKAPELEPAVGRSGLIEID